ncbi:hypothetical protein GIB67_029469 [Kingdonia uniflora]|uniref:Uncharacterized protein n=1 Tax=Kingdonia uniflora TaxID=39325 RepID=A0A7J7NXV9_9MAGN|nr:hypothetical protein GIB67_029469 [Kingdonia uniflora]
MVLTSGCAMADEVDFVGHLSPVIGVGDEEDVIAELEEWPHLEGSRVEYPTGSSRFREFCKAKCSIDRIWGHAFGYRGNFFRTCSVNQGGDYLYLLPDLTKEKKYRRLGDEVSLEYVQGVVKDNQTDGFYYYLAHYDYGLTPPLSNLAKSVMNMIGDCPTQLNCNFWEVILVCETLNERWAASGSERRITAKDFLEYYAVKYATATDGINCKVLRKESFIDVAAREGTELEAVLKKLEISRFKRVASKDDKVRRSQVKRRMAGKNPGTMEEKLLTSELNTPLKLARLNEMPDGPVDMATVSNTVVWNLAKKNAVKRGAASRSVTSDSVDDSSKRRKVTSPTKSQVVLEESYKITEGADLRPHFEVEAGLLEEQCRAKAREKMVVVVDDEFKKNNLAGKLYQLRYRKAEILAFSERNYEEKEFMDEEKVEEMEDCLNVAEKTAVDSQEIIDQKIESSRLRVVDLEGPLEVEKISSAELQLEEAKSQVEDMIVTILSRDLALNQLTSELPELKEKVASGFWHETELAEYCIRALNNVISDMKCNICALNEQFLKKEIDLDTARTDLAVSEADFEKLNNSIAGKDSELRNSAQIRDSLIARFDRLKADLRRLKGREAQSRADLAEVQAKNKSFVDDLAHARGNMSRAVQRDKEMNERINQFCPRISELERELRVGELKYEKALKFELDKRDGEIASGKGSRGMKEFLRRK